MIVLVVVAGLASVAYRATQYVVRTKRAEGKAALLRPPSPWSAHEHNTYPSSLSAAGVTHSGDSPQGFLHIAMPPARNLASSYVLTATPANGHVDPKCGNLSIDQLGRKGETGTLTVADCW